MITRLTQLIDTTYPYIGPNKRQEVSRLVYEIAKRESLRIEEVTADMPAPPALFSELKTYLIKRRFPVASRSRRAFSESFPKVDIDPALSVDINAAMRVVPQNVWIEEAVAKSEMAVRMRRLFPDARYQTIERYRDVVKDQTFGVKAYNDRRANIYVVHEDYSFQHKCPCSHKSVSCGLHVVNLGAGCHFDCAYCYLQDYINSPGIVLPANLEDFFEAFKNYKQDITVGSGELTDSLVYDHITGFSPRIVNFFRDYPDTFFEFKTKSANVDLLLSVEASPNIVISWSVNPPSVIRETEHFTATLDQRLDAARRCADHGYKVAFNFDPMMHYAGWEDEYEGLVNRIFDTVDEASIKTLSLGTLRMTPRLKKIIENRFPQTRILDEEFLKGHDGKLRYLPDVRADIYKKMMSWIRKRSASVYLFLCMEEKDVCQTCEAPPVKRFSTLQGSQIAT